MSEPVRPLKVFRAPWKLDDGRVIHLIREEELKLLPDGEKLIAIDGEEVIKGTDYIDLDTRGGMLAYGLPADHERCLLTYETVVRV